MRLLNGRSPSNYVGGITSHDAAIRYIACYYGPGANYNPVSDVHPWQYDHSGPYPYIIANDDRPFY